MQDISQINGFPEMTYMAWATDGPWISQSEAQKRLAIGRNALNGLIAKGFLTARQIPGCAGRVLATDVDALAERSTRQATVKDVRTCV